ncbi:MAG: response regulator [Kiritimatiellia bacterium]
MNAKPKIRVFLADDHTVVRMGLAAIISIEKDLVIVGEADNGLTAVERIVETRPDVVIMDLMMPKLGGAEATERILKTLPETRILLLTTYTSPEDTQRALAAGAVGALVKDSSQPELIGAIRRVFAGERVISPAILASVSRREAVQLSVRQLEILTYASRGFSNNEIARLAKVGPDCVKAHLKAIFARLGASSRTEAVTIAFQQGIITP